MTDYNDLWELDRGDYVNIITELRADLAAAEQSLSLARTDQATAEAQRDRAEGELDEARKALAAAQKLREAASKSGLEVAKSTLDYYAMEKRNARTYEKLAAAYAAKASRQRRTIRALVVAFRDALHLTRRVASDETWDMWLQLVQRQAAERREADRRAVKE